jgi:hypothetical protein
MLPGRISNTSRQDLHTGLVYSQQLPRMDACESSKDQSGLFSLHIHLNVTHLHAYWDGNLFRGECERACLRQKKRFANEGVKGCATVFLGASS